MFILTSDPEKGELSRAFDILDDAFGTEQFDKNSAVTALKEGGFTSATFDKLVSGGFVTEVA